MTAVSDKGLSARYLLLPFSRFLADPEVTEVAWIPASELIEHLAYADERKLARIAHDRLPELARKERAEGRATPR